MKKVTAILFALLLAGCAGQDVQTAAEQAEIIKSPNDDRQYQHLVLANGLRVVLVSDPEADKAAAALTVGVGSMSNPPDREGLAHFLEHMLFLGTEKYPDVDEYSAFIKRHGGSDNAFTGGTQTTYFFDIKQEKLEPALDRFAQFFISPLFNEEYVEREKHAVHSEYQLKLKDDSRRIAAAEKQSYNPGSPYSRFSVGSLDTLEDRPGRKVRDDLIAFYLQHYSANIMGLAVIGREPLPVLRRWVEEKFSTIPNRKAERFTPTDEEKVYLPSQLPVQVDVVPLKKLHRLTLTFMLPAATRHYKVQPYNYLAHYLGHEGKGSLHALLRDKGWITSLSAGGQILDPVQGVFQISMELTETGMARVEQIVDYLFQYTRLLAAQGIEAWRYDEQRRKSELDFRFQEKQPVSRYVTTLSEKLLDYPPEDLLRAGQVMEQYDPTLLKEYLGYLVPDNLAMTRVDQKLKSDQIESRYKVAYAIARPAEKQLAAWRGNPVVSALSLPGPNPFLPEKAELKPVLANAPAPVGVEPVNGISLWHQQDDEFGTPKAAFAAQLEFPLAVDTPQHAVELMLLVDLVEDELNQFAYPATVAGLSYQVKETAEGLSLLLYGYDEKQPVLLERVLEVLRNPQLPEARFQLYKAKLERDLRNKALDRPYRQVLDERNRILVKPSWSPREKLAVLDSIQRQDIASFARRIFDTVEARLLTYGNLTESEARNMARVLHGQLLQDSRLEPVPERQLTLIPPGTCQRSAYPVDHPDSVLVAYYQGNARTIREQALWRLLGQVIGSPFFASLRTKQQLGYAVGAGFTENEKMPGLSLVVQSSVVSADEIEKRVNRFLDDFLAELEAMDAKEFASHKAGLLSSLLKKDERLISRVSRYLDNLEREVYDFDFKRRVAAEVEKLDKQTLVAFYRRNLLEKPRLLLVYSPGTRFSSTAAAIPRSRDAAASCPAVAPALPGSLDTWAACPANNGGRAFPEYPEQAFRS